MASVREKWNLKHGNRSKIPSDPDPFLVASRQELKSGTVLDLACGAGHNSVYLAEQGFSVTSADISDVALDRLDRFARVNRLDISTLAIDLENPDTDYSGALKTFDNIVIFNYKPSESLWNLLPSLLVGKGILLYCTFNLKHWERNGFPKRFCVRPGEHARPQPLLAVRSYQELDSDNQYRDGYVFSKDRVDGSGADW